MYVRSLSFTLLNILYAHRFWTKKVFFFYFIKICTPNEQTNKWYRYTNAMMSANGLIMSNKKKRILKTLALIKYSLVSFFLIFLFFFRLCPPNHKILIPFFCVFDNLNRTLDAETIYAIVVCLFLSCFSILFVLVSRNELFANWNKKDMCRRTIWLHLDFKHYTSLSLLIVYKNCKLKKNWLIQTEIQIKASNKLLNLNLGTKKKKLNYSVWTFKY